VGDPGAPGSLPAGGVSPDVFWALDGLRRRAPADAGGAVLFTGVVRTPDGATWEWQETHRGDDLLDRACEDAGAALEALASPVRMLLLREVLQGRDTAAELAELAEFGTSGQVYHHLRRLTAAGWLRTAARGRYAVPPERIVPLLATIAAVQR
jgi:DNA-binding transcriptional ArsR family regulator